MKKLKGVPKKRLITPTGRLIEKISFRFVGWSILGLILSSGIFFHYYGVQQNGIACDIDLDDALYFSVITFSSLGYGDFAPIGLGKLVASFEVIGGLVLIAVFVGKIASERQAALLLLIYTSEQQERIAKFTTELKGMCERIDKTIQEKDYEKLAELSTRAYKYASSICSYLIVHANQGELASFGNISSLRKLYGAFLNLQQTSFRGMQLYAIPQRTSTTLGNTIGILSGNAARMRPFHKNDDKAHGLLEAIALNGKSLKKFNEKLATGTIVLRSETEMTPELINKVQELLDNNPKQRDFHKTIANILGISNSLAAQCMKVCEGIK